MNQKQKHGIYKQGIQKRDKQAGRTALFERGQKKKEEKRKGTKKNSFSFLTEDDDARGAVADLLVLRPRELDDRLVLFFWLEKNFEEEK